VLEKVTIEQAHEQIKAAFGPVDILINGAGGNHPKGTTSKEFLTVEDVTQKKDGVTTFYYLTVDGIQFVFNLNFLGTFLPTQVFSKDMVQKDAATSSTSPRTLKPLARSRLQRRPGGVSNRSGSRCISPRPACASMPSPASSSPTRTAAS
jgi:NAD(P)-dependent dehydrogenase (short-subunit alcohol dehydrogenase family)